MKRRTIRGSAAMDCAKDLTGELMRLYGRVQSGQMAHGAFLVAVDDVYHRADVAQVGEAVRALVHAQLREIGAIPWTARR